MKAKSVSFVSLLSSLIVVALAFVGSLRAAPPSADDVGDADTFGRNAVYMGAASGFVQLSVTLGN